MADAAGGGGGGGGEGPVALNAKVSGVSSKTRNYFPETFIWQETCTKFVK